MESFWKRVAFGLILAYRMLWQTTCSSDCPFYTFHENTKNWQKARLECQANGGDLLSIETENEYQFINKSIQNLNKGINEWYIGLKKTTGVWKWINGRSLSINKWQPREPSRDGSCVIMAKNWPPGKYGLFNDLRCSVSRMFICEFKEVSNNVQGVLKYCQGEIATTRPITTTPSATRTKSTIHELTSLSRSYSAAPTTIKSYTKRSTSRQVSPNPKALRTPGKTSKQFPTMVVAIILGILLAVGICAFFVVFWWLKRKSGQSKSKREPWPSYTAAAPTAENRAYLTNRRNNLLGQPATEAIQLTELDSELYAEIPDDLRPSDSPSSSLSEVEYANSPNSTLPPSGYANLIQNPVYENQMRYETLNRYAGDMEEGEIAI